MKKYIIVSSKTQQNISIMPKEQFDKQSNLLPIEDCDTVTEAKEKAPLIQHIGILNYLANYVTD